MWVINGHPDTANVTFSARLQMKDHDLILHISTQQEESTSHQKEVGNLPETQAEVSGLGIVHRRVVFAASGTMVLT